MSLRKATRIEIGDQVRVSFRILETKNADLPDNFESMPTMESETRRMNQSLGKKTNGLLSDYVDAIRNLDSRVRKAFEIVQRSKSVPRTAQPNKKNRNK